MNRPNLKLRNGKKGDMAFATRLENWQKDFKLDVVAHSNGGLIARYFFYYGDKTLDNSDKPPEFDWGGTKEIQRLFLVGTPKLGAPKALKILPEGSDDIPTQYYNPDIVGSFPSVYQLLPKEAEARINDGNKPIEVDLFDIKTWLKQNWGIAKSDKKNAKAYLEACLNRAKKFHEALKASPKRLLYFFFLGLTKKHGHQFLLQTRVISQFGKITDKPKMGMGLSLTEVLQRL